MASAAAPKEGEESLVEMSSRSCEVSDEIPSVDGERDIL